LASDYLPITLETPLPTPEEVRSWWDRFGMLPNIRRHSEVVRLVALVLADWLAESGVALSRRAVEVGALAHDLAKTPCLGTSRLHAQEGEAMLQELGYPELAFMVGRHVTLLPDHPLDETMVVNYADKRVTHDEIVGLEERFAYIQERYGQGDPERLERIRQGLDRVRRAEKEIFRRLPGRSPDELLGLAAGPVARETG
jgi:hypothetical protein